MLRQAMSYSFNDGVGKDPASYIGNDDKIEKFLDWYGDFCRLRNEVLFIYGPRGSGKATFLQHCSNFISQKANYDLLEKKGLTSQKDQFIQLPQSKFNWVSNEELTMRNNSFLSVLSEKIKPGSFLRRFTPYIAPSFSLGPGSPEYSVKISADYYPRRESAEDLADYLKKRASDNYILWIKSLPEDQCENLVNFHRDIKAAGVTNLGIIVSIDRDFSSYDDLDIKENSIVFNPLTVEELSCFIMLVCHKNSLRFDFGLADTMISHGYNTYGQALKLLQEIEKKNRSYISRAAAVSLMEGEQ